MTREDQAKDFVKRTLTMIEKDKFDTHDTEVIATSLEYGFLQGYAARLTEEFVRKLFPSTAAM